MKTSLAGYNLLIIEPLKFELNRLEKEFIKLGANVFPAQDIVQGLALQKKWDIDVVFCNISFMTGLATVISKETFSHEGKGSPLLFTYGSNLSVHPKSMVSKGVLKFFNVPLDFNSVSEEIARFLFDPRLHLERLSRLHESFPQISFILQDGARDWSLEVLEFTDEGLTTNLDEVSLVSSSCLLSVFLPGSYFKKFTVKVEKKDEENVYKVKIHLPDRNLWQYVLTTLENKQDDINNFLLTSSGK